MFTQTNTQTQTQSQSQTQTQTDRQTHTHLVAIIRVCCCSADLADLRLVFRHFVQSLKADSYLVFLTEKRVEKTRQCLRS
jgi:hypothetical protein